MARENPITVAAEYLEDANFENDEVRALTRSLIGEMKYRKTTRFLPSR